MQARYAYCSILCFAAAMAFAGQMKPDFTGSWEFTGIEENGQRFPPRSGFKETQVWAQRESNLNIKMTIFSNGYYSLDLAYVIGGKRGPVGSGVSGAGRKDPVNGSAYWEGDRLVYEQEHPNAEKGAIKRIVRSVHLEKDGTEMVADQTYWVAGSDKKLEQKCYWQKKRDLP